MIARCLGDAGKKEFEKWLLDGAPGKSPAHLLLDSEYSSAITFKIDLKERQFENRFELGKYLAEQIPAPAYTELSDNPGFWNWISLFYFDQLCPLDGSGKRNVLHAAQYIAEMRDYRTYYRHLVRFATMAYKLFGQDSRVFLISPRGGIKHTDLCETIASRQNLIGNPMLISLLQCLYFDNSKNAPKRGIVSGQRAGTARRLETILSQFDRTFDLHEMKVKQALTILPVEFNKWKQ